MNRAKENTTSHSQPSPRLKKPPTSNTKPIRPLSSANRNIPATGIMTRKPIGKSGIDAKNGLDKKENSHAPVKSMLGAKSSVVRPTPSLQSKAPPKRKPLTDIARPQKRPTWDLRGKISDMEQQLGKDLNQIGELEKFRMNLETTMESKESQTHEALRRVQELETTIKATKEHQAREIAKIKAQNYAKNRQLEEDNKRNKEQMSGFSDELNDIHHQLLETKKTLQYESEENKTLRATIEKTSSSFVQVDADLRSLKTKLEIEDNELGERTRELQDLKERLVSTKARGNDLETQLLDEEKTRRYLHNKIQELKGNIRVFCRVRPILKSEKQHKANLANIRFHGENSDKLELTESVSSSLGKVTTKTYPFSFDKVFSPEATQQDCFEEISQLVQSALDGYNVCIFAYGQTGSGKTFTMQGPPSPTAETAGMIPRAVQQIYTVVEKLRDRSWEYRMEGQFMEIYNETVHDLLGDASEYGKVKHEIRHEKNGRTTVTDMTTVVLDSPAKVNSMLRKASHNRATGATNINERSSRSHSVFTLRITGGNTVTGQACDGVLNLIDLAGSERLSLSGSTGDRLRETQAINKSLSCLGDVIHALANKDGGHVPYRNSKLTYLLQNSLGGNSKTLMFVNASPLSEHFGETLCSLRFATKVNSCHIGVAKKTSK